ncbi:mRNA cap guanine-N7 methyltransferase 1 [Dendrobium catenatum]|uniref:mRNA cap guanine-N7 methyltransferase 1 n=1 Tax=Dendrobium catenatum TaxID=906689 RepID=A0A2I0XDG4_9ASPA|nr:mRNA cap guanine-N7 methyltransferase 1 [Dendrobium catenatum]
MKRGYGEPPSASYSSSQLKRKWNSFDESSSFADESTRKARKVADHYSARSNQTLEEREASPIIHLKKLNNWVR